ncbi:MAG: hypothetical protein Fur0018_02560 [Anaerolineales bacterium]
MNLQVAVRVYKVRPAALLHTLIIPAARDFVPEQRRLIRQTRKNFHWRGKSAAGQHKKSRQQHIDGFRQTGLTDTPE